MASLGFVAPQGAFQPPVAGALRGTVGLGAAPSFARAAPAGAVRPGLAACATALGSAALAAAFGARAGRRRAPRARGAAVVPLRAAKVGDAIPNIGLDKGFPPDKVPLAEYCKGKKVVLVGLPGAFTPT
mmetsp:Transcript_61604/g.190833  ORF Transcript_61604/g.190833 Transcript_61604/m.190833 type:complete len:129 (+) Transcript_61604:96-482(+)